jgi:hypothetical protein
MQYETNNNADMSGTSLVGYVQTDYNTLLEIFGEPEQYENGEGDGKVTVEWRIVFTDHDSNIHRATIYDWKQYDDGTPYGLYDWHIGGDSIESVEFIQALVPRLSRGL